MDKANTRTTTLELRRTAFTGNYLEEDHGRQSWKKEKCRRATDSPGSSSFRLQNCAS